MLFLFIMSNMALKDVCLYRFESIGSAFWLVCKLSDLLFIVKLPSILFYRRVGNRIHLKNCRENAVYNKMTSITRLTISLKKRNHI